MKRAELGDIFLYNGDLVKVIGINDGQRSIIFQDVDAEICECCGEIKQYNIIESSPLFQDYSEPVKTIKQD